MNGLDSKRQKDALRRAKSLEIQAEEHRRNARTCEITAEAIRERWQLPPKKVKE
jgi:hypothetical protein